MPTLPETHYAQVRRKGSLSNDYILPLSITTNRRILSRLPIKSINNLAYLWCRLTPTQPNLKSRQEYKLNHLTRPQLIAKAIELFSRHAKAILAADAHSVANPQGDEPSNQNNNIQLYSKRQLINKVLVDFWHNGLNLLQLSQIDCQLLIDKPNSHKWSSLKVINNFNKAQETKVPNGNYQKISAKLSKNLSTLFLNHIYLCRHPVYPLLIIRIQLFDIVSRQSTARSSTNWNDSNIISRKPFFVLVPASSTFIIHSSYNKNDIVSKLILQSLEKALSTANNQIHLNPDDPDSNHEIRNLESIFLLNGNSRFGNCSGSWTCYADDNVDISPLDNPLTHNTIVSVQEEGHLLNNPTRESLKRPGESDNDSDELQELNDQDQIEAIEFKRLQKVANLRFKGTSNGTLKSSRLFEDDIRPPLKKLKVNTHGNGRSSNSLAKENQVLQRNLDSGKFASIIPVQSVEFIVHAGLKSSKDEHKSASRSRKSPWLSVNEELSKPKFKIKLSGSDVFAGLHELSVTKTNAGTAEADSTNASHATNIKKTPGQSTFVDPFKIPSWLTGEEGPKSGIIIKNRFYKSFSEVEGATDYFKQFEGGAII